jgi:hypothetical protein
MSQEPEDDDLEPEYDFTGAVRGKYYERYQEGTNAVLLDPDVAKAQTGGFSGPLTRCGSRSLL